MQRRTTTLCVLAIFLVIFTKNSFADNEDEVKVLPGLSEAPKFKHYSGYLNATSQKFLHYWFVESQNDPDNDPVVLWLNGGPGCSSMEGMLAELGPFHVEKGGKTLTLNPFSWNLISNVIFLEAPAGVGYSYGLNPDYTTDDDTVSLENYNALKHFFQKFPQFKNNEFYITGESYGGMYIPTLSVRVLADPSFNFKGFAIGNGYLNKVMNTNSLVFFAYNHGLIDDNLFKRIVDNCCQDCVMTTCNFATNPSTTCNTLVQKGMQNLDGLNVYNLYSDCLSSSQKKKARIDYQNLFNSLSFPLSLREAPPCTDDRDLLTYMNSKAVRQALHIPPSLPTWDLCSDNVSTTYKRLYDTMRPQILELVQSGKLRGLIYNGDIDMACNFLGDEWFVDNLDLEPLTNYNQWTFELQVAGFVKTFPNLTYATIRGSGHMVPQNKPGPSFKMFSNFLYNKPLA